MQACLYYSVFGNVLGGYRNGDFMEKWFAKVRSDSEA